MSNEEEINIHKGNRGKDNYQAWFANIKRTYDAYQDIDLERVRRAQNDYDALREQSRRAVEDALSLRKQLDALIIKRLDESWGDDLANRRNTAFNVNMNQAGANRLWFETEIPEAEALAELIKAGKLGDVNLALWIERLENIVAILQSLISTIKAENTGE